MKIVIASHHFPPNYQAGAELYAYRLAKGLQERGHKVVVCCIEDVEGPSIQPEVVIDEFDGLTVNRLYLDFYDNPDHIRWDYCHPAIGNWFQAFFAQQQPDIVHINSGYLLSASVIEVAKKCGIPTVFTLHDYWFICPRITLLQADGSICSHPVEPIRCTWCLLSKKRRFLIPDQLMHGKIGDAFVMFGEHKFVQKIIGLENVTNAIADRQTILPSFYETLDVVISPSSFLLQKMDEYGLKAQKAVHLPNALSMDAYTIPENRNNLKPIRFGYLGQIEPHKGIHTLVKALKKVNADPDLIELVIYGNKDRNPKYTKYLSRLSKHFKNIRFSGTYSQDELPEILRNIDALVVPSEWYENYPTVILEAQYFKKPVIAAKIGGIPELVQDRVNGFLYSPGDVDELASIMQGIVDHPNMLTDLTLVDSPGKNQVDYICEIQDIYTNLLSH
jgi:glycosyltransferase involved in cell wall biosynthesis